jgi:hypothetical protein
MKEISLLPEQWCVKASSSEEQTKLNTYARSIGGYHWEERNNYAKNFMLHVENGRYALGQQHPHNNYTEITFAEFEECVLGTKKQFDDGKTELQRFNELIQAIKSK